MERYLHKMENIKLQLSEASWASILLGLGGRELQAKIYGDSCTFLTGSLLCASIKEIAGNVIECNGLGSKLVEML